MITTATPQGSILQVSGLEKSFGATHALRGVSIEVEGGEIMAILGPSGCGKSTLLSNIAGLEHAERGTVLWEGRSLEGVPPHQRGFGLMFQDFALFPHRNVFNNVAFGLQMAHWERSKIEPRVHEVLELVGLPDFAGRDVNNLSGGEQQRVALARSLAPRPKLLMLDEPLGSLDRNLRERLAIDLRQILTSTRQTAIYVTHDQDEAFSLADRMAVMNAGRVEQIGRPQEIYLRPATVFVARFLGLSNLIPGRLSGDGEQKSVRTPIGVFPVNTSLQGDVTMLLRPDVVRTREAAPCQIQGSVVETTFHGQTIRLVLQINSEQLTFNFRSNEQFPAPGETMQLSFWPEQALQLFPSTNNEE
jgi:ABC-type Fe3+/spermidine/putrescine transport system ATPase subunit